MESREERGQTSTSQTHNNLQSINGKYGKGFLFRNFLSPGTKFNPPLVMPSQHELGLPSLPVSKVRTFLDIEDENLGLSELLSHAPRALRTFLGEIILPQDNGLYISEAIVAGECLGASDGSLIKGFKTIKGGHGYALRGRDSIKNEILGLGPSPTSDSMSSMTTEHYGLLGLLVLLHRICKKFRLCQEECFDSVIIYIDNKTVVERGRKKQEKLTSGTTWYWTKTFGQ